MPLWRDPLDELIADLERTLPSASQSVEIGWTSEMLVGCQLLVRATMRRTPEEVERLKQQDPRARAYWAYVKRMAERRRPIGQDTHDAPSEDAQEQKPR